MSNQIEPPTKQRRQFPIWVSAVLPLILLAILLVVLAFGNPIAILETSVPPAEALVFDQIRVVPDGFDVTLVNAGPDQVTVAQVLVDDAYWEFVISPSQDVPRLGRADLFIPYPWVEAEPHEIRVITNTGATFDGGVEISTPSPEPGVNELLAFGLIGIYVGIIPVLLGLLFYPFMKKLDRKWIGAILALTVGLLVFLLIDTLLEAIELAVDLPGVFQGIAVVLFSALTTWLLLLAIRANRSKTTKPQSRLQKGIGIATLIAFSIGLHNLGEGLAIGTALSLGEVALGSFLIIGFTLHNITEGIGIASPLLPDSSGENKLTGEEAVEQGPKLLTFLRLAILAGAPAIIGVWIGGFTSATLLSLIFLGVGVGAIWQVIVEVGNLLRNYANSEDQPIISWPNLGGFTLGFMIMFLTAFLVSF